MRLADDCTSTMQFERRRFAADDRRPAVVVDFQHHGAVPGSTALDVSVFTRRQDGEQTGVLPVIVRLAVRIEKRHVMDGGDRQDLVASGKQMQQPRQHEHSASEQQAPTARATCRKQVLVLRRQCVAIGHNLLTQAKTAPL